MAPSTQATPQRHPTSNNLSKKSLLNRMKSIQRDYFNVNYVKSLLFDPAQLPIVSVAILVIELMINIFIVQRVNYTEIDWIAYMQQCDGFLNGTTNYAHLKGDTGPLVYPAGHVYIYTVLYYLTNRGQNIRLAQYCFIGIYLLQMHLVLKIYSKSRKLPPYALVFSAFTAYRIHSIYVLRLFNDPIAIVLFWAALDAYLNSKWTTGSVLLSVGVSVKMNVLLFAPAIFLLYLINLGVRQTIQQLCVCAGVQLILGAPFLLTHPIEYLRGSFNFGRVFEHKWTVNYRFLPVDIFEHKYFHVALLLMHVCLLIVFIMPAYKYFQGYCRLRTLQAQLQPQIDSKNRENDSASNALGGGGGKKANKKKKSKNDAAAAATATATATATVEQTEEEMSIHQKIFLKSFEEMLRKTSGAPPAPSPPPPPKPTADAATQDTKTQQTYQIHFDRAVQLALLPIFLTNFIGVVCSRTLHYQFYVWYFHSLPYLAWCTDYNVSLKLLLLGLIEFAFNTFPSTSLSSGLLQLSHLILLWGVGSKLLRAEQDSQRIKVQ